MSARHSIVRDDFIEYTFVIVFGDCGEVRLTREQPRLGSRERAMSIIAKLPTSLFKTPTLRGSIAIADPAAPPLQIDLQAAAEALRQSIGCEVELHVVQDQTP